MLIEEVKLYQEWHIAVTMSIILIIFCQLFQFRVICLRLYSVLASQICSVCLRIEYQVVVVIREYKRKSIIFRRG